MDLSLTLNHRPWSGPLADPSLTLLQFLRREGLTGAKEGCAEGDFVGGNYFTSCISFFTNGEITISTTPEMSA